MAAATRPGTNRGQPGLSGRKNTSENTCARGTGVLQALLGLEETNAATRSCTACATSSCTMYISLETIYVSCLSQRVSFTVPWWDRFNRKRPISNYPKFFIFPLQDARDRIIRDLISWRDNVYFLLLFLNFIFCGLLIYLKVNSSEKISDEVVFIEFEFV